MQAVTLPESIRVVVLDTSTRRRLGGGYNDRRRECEADASVLGPESLRDLPMDELPAAAAKLNAVALRRVRHVVTENARTQAGIAALYAGAVPSFVEDLPPRYRALTGLEPSLLVCQASQGTAFTRL